MSQSIAIRTAPFAGATAATTIIYAAEDAAPAGAAAAAWSATGLAWAYMANQRPADAIRTIEPVLASGWTAAEPYIVAAEAYALAGQPKQADEARRQALAINPHSFDRNPGVVWLEH